MPAVARVVEYAIFLRVSYRILSRCAAEGMLYAINMKKKLCKMARSIFNLAARNLHQI